MSLSWLKKKPLRIGLGAKRILVSGTRGSTAGVELQSGRRLARRARRAARDPQVAPRQRGQRGARRPVRALRAAAHNDAVKSHEQWLALARHRFGALHGAAAADWDVKVTQTAPLGARLACAVDRELVEGLISAFVDAGVNLISVQPFLVAAFNRIRKTVGNGSCWIVVEEPGRLTLALLQRGAWVAIRSRRSDERWRVVLPEILERESAFLGLDQPCTRVIVCAQGEFNPEMHDAWRAQAVSYRELALAWE